MTDHELLKLAAKAAGVGDVDIAGRPCVLVIKDSGIYQRCWNPLTDDGDALRLAVQLHMSVMVFPDPDQRSEACSHKAANFCDEAARHNGGDVYAATRRAIVRAAAEIGCCK